MVQVRKNHFDDQMQTKRLPADCLHVGSARGALKSFEDNPRQTFEQQTPRSTWEGTQGKVGPSKTQFGESVAPPSIVETKGPKKGMAAHPHWRKHPEQARRMDAIANAAHKHTKVNPEGSSY
jgi:hypothetical protein